MNHVMPVASAFLAMFALWAPILVIFFWCIFVPCVAATLAQAKGRLAVGWAFLGLLFGPFAWIVTALPPLPPLPLLKEEL